jgi:Rhodopirellula transposase DDE domain
VTRIAAVADSTRPTVARGQRELALPPDPTGRTRAPGGGPKPLSVTDPGLLDALDALVDPDTRGDPSSPLRWTTKSLRQLADALGQAGHPVSPTTVGRLLHAQGTRSSAPERPWKVPSTPTVTPSSPTSTPRPRRT